MGRLTATLDTMLGELARSRDDQQRLVQDAGHELRTPLTSLRTNVSVMRRFTELAPGQRAVARRRRRRDPRADQPGRRARRARHGSPRRGATPAVDLADLVEQSAARARRRSSRAIAVDAERVVVSGRPNALERAVSNLLDNAIKFDPDSDQPIELHADASRIEVRDHGPGIAPDDAPHVFDRFYRATTARSFPGSGLGLAIVRDVAHLHDGRPYATDRPGGGAVIGFTLGTAPGAATGPGGG